MENGPLRLVIQAFSGLKPQAEMIVAEADFAFACLNRVAQSLPLLKQRHGLISSAPPDQIAKTMLESVRLIQEPDLTPMAAVAGTIADFVADHLFTEKVTKVIVDNGGDIAIRLNPGETARVGFRPDIESQQITHVIELVSEPPDFSTWGVNTSGMGGRSLTRGIASAVTAFAGTSSVADAAATAIANNCFAADDNIRQVPARLIDPNTDLGDMLITVDGSGLSEMTYEKALNSGLDKANLLVKKDIIRGALLSVGGKMGVTPDFSQRVGELYLCGEN
ncbi:MAG: UPF0280 family protein [Gammaproteobacteria bacterium]|nr:UPF0280 family protein [Gammaproteobacteria bacterium]